MTLLNDFFKILDAAGNDAGFMATIELNPNHAIYASHFPGFPVTPGVIHIQIVHELLEHHFGKALKLQSIVQCKFLKIVDPNIAAQLVVHIEFSEADGLLKIKARGEHGGDLCLRLSASYVFCEL